MSETAKKTRRRAVVAQEESDKRPPGRPALPDELKRTAMISRRTYPDVADKIMRNGTVWLERLVRRAKDAAPDEIDA